MRPMGSRVVMSCAKMEEEVAKIDMSTRRRVIVFYRINKMFQDLQNLILSFLKNLVNPVSNYLPTRGGRRPGGPHHPRISHARSSRARPATGTHAPQPLDACASQTGPIHSPRHHQSQS